MKKLNYIDVSIIVPLYKGGKYVSGIIKQVEECALQTDKSVELVFVNDYPDESISNFEGKDCVIRVINNKKNIGIHGSRVEGLKASNSEYVVFLDQDDYIRPNYIVEQLEKIGNASSVVCRLLNGGREHYTDSFKFEEVISLQFMLKNWCSIVSPGQVLIKRSSIPDVWTTNIVRNNGADDYFLWLSMLCIGESFVLNDNILFEHRLTGVNTSLDTNKMMDSEHEVLQILRENPMYKQYESDYTALEVSLRRIHIKQLDNISMAYTVLKTFYMFDKATFEDLFGGKVAIYGAADIGKAFALLFSNTQMNYFFIDRNAEYIALDVPIYRIEDAPIDVDSVIIAVNGSACKEIKNNLLKKYKCHIHMLSEVIDKYMK